MPLRTDNLNSTAKVIYFPFSNSKGLFIFCTPSFKKWEKNYSMTSSAAASSAGGSSAGGSSAAGASSSAGGSSGAPSSAGGSSVGSIVKLVTI